MATYGDNFYGFGQPNPNVTLRDYQHANRMYVANYYRLLPKYKGLYSVLVRPNPSVIQDIKDLSSGSGGTSGNGGSNIIGAIQDVMNTVKDVIDTPNRLMNQVFGDPSEGTKVRELSALAHRVELPGFSITVDEKNQYNKKIGVTTGIKYDPVQITFYDDNNNTTINLINNYYKYFFGDGNVPGGSQKYLTDTVKSRMNFNGWGFQSRAIKNFFYAIDIYSFNRGTFTMHSIKAPWIINMRAGDHEYGDYAPRDITITFGHSGIVYASGYIKRGTPPGFADLIYDFTPSPLTGKYPVNLYDTLGQFASATGGLFGGTTGVQDIVKPIQQLQGGTSTNVPSTRPLLPGTLLAPFNTGSSQNQTSTPNGVPVSVGGLQSSGTVVGGGQAAPPTPSVTVYPTIRPSSITTTPLPALPGTPNTSNIPGR